MAGVTEPTNPSPPLGPSPRMTMATSRTHKAKGVVTMEEASLLPDIRTSDNLWNAKDPLPTSLQSDFIPENILQALIQAPPHPEQLGPSSRHRNLNVSTIPKRAPPANVWGHPQRREKVKHLTEKIPCLCGAGRDISFLYDVPKKERPKKVDENDQSAVRAEEEPRKSIQLPDTLVPDEYHIVRNKGVLGLEYIEDNFATQPKDHEKHLVSFPSLNPTSRQEVKNLKRTMQEMLDRLGINDLSAELKGPTQMHNLIELIKKEQNIYNIVFHELIRQVSVECLDRGELLSLLREQYSSLLNRVPLQIKGLHEEVMAQRALDRRLTEELMRFKSTIGILTSELSYVKEHDMAVSAQATQAQEDLKSALAESQKNASLLAEYHDLYELQRRRLETQVHMLAEEKELWSTAAYSLALKVTEEHSLNTAKRLHVSEKAWAKLANHFTILLSDKDTVKLTSLQEYVDHWRDLVDDFNAGIRMREDDMKKTLTGVQNSLREWKAEFRKKVMNKDGQHVQKGLDRERAAKLYSDIKNWGQLFNQEGEKFGGDTLLGGQESLMRIRRQVEGWTDCALNVFTRHRGEDGSNYPDHNEMLKMNEFVDDLMSQYYVRLTGENGVATGLIQVTNGLDMWDGKLNTFVHGSNPMPEHDWSKIYIQFDDWVESIESTKYLIGTTQKEDDRNGKRVHEKIELSEVMKMTQKWLSSATNGIDSEDAKLVEQVNTLHTEMVKWMVQLLLRLAPDRESHSQEAKEAVLEGTTSMAQLVANAKSLFQRLSAFSKYVAMCCNGIVMDLMQQKIDNHEEDADHEYRDLQRLKNECDDWINTAKMLLGELTGEPFPETPIPSAMDMAPPIPDGLQSKEPTKDSLLIEDEQMTTSEFAPLEDDPGEAEVETQAPVEQEAPEEKAPESTQAPDVSPADQIPTIKEPELVVTEPESAPGEGKPEEQTTAEGTAADAQAPEETEAPTEEKDDSIVLQVIGHDENTRTKTIPEQPKSEAPIDPRPVTTPGTPDPKKAFEAIAALESLQNQLISTEERAQTAEERAANAEAELKKTLERLKSLERKVAVTPSESEGAERPESVATEASTVKEKGAEAEKEKDKEKPKTAKDKDKEKRSSSKASNKSKKK